jgi:hypothetical protein
LDKASVFSLKTRNPLLQSHWNHWIRFPCLIESVSEVSLKLLNPLPRSHWERGSRRIRTQIWNGFIPGIRGPSGDSLMGKNWGSKISWHSPIKVTYCRPKALCSVWGVKRRMLLATNAPYWVPVSITYVLLVSVYFVHFLSI